MPFYWSIEWLRQFGNGNCDGNGNEYRNGSFDRNKKGLKKRMKDKTQKMKAWLVKAWLKMKKSLLRNKHDSYGEYKGMRRDQELEEFYKTAWEWNEQELDLELKGDVNEKTPLMNYNYGVNMNKECIYSYYN